MRRRSIWLRLGLAFVLGVIFACGGILFLLGRVTGSSAGSVDFFRALTVIQHSYVGDVDASRLWEGAITGMVDSLGDPHSIYMDEAMYTEFQSATSGSFGGVGLVVGKKDDQLVVISPIEGTPGELAGVKSGDIIIAIDGQDTASLNLTEAVGKIRGEEGSTVVLRIQRGDELREYNIVRENIKIHAVGGKMLDDSIGYLRITNFNETVVDELKAEYARLEAEGMKRIILDLRDNPGGLLTESVGVAEMFVKQGPVVSIVEHDGTKTVYESQSNGCPYPIVVLVNHGSASAAEIVAGAVQDTQAGILMGTKTYGKGSVQSLMPLTKGAVKLTIAKYYTPNERLIDGIGLEPDVVIEASETERQDKVLERAIEYLKTK